MFPTTIPVVPIFQVSRAGSFVELGIMMHCGISRLLAAPVRSQSKLC